MEEEKNKNIFDKIGQFFYEFFDIVKGLDREGTIIGITEIIKSTCRGCLIC